MKPIKYKVGIIGCGNIFKRHLEAINENSDFFKLSCICDNNTSRLYLLSKEHEVEGFYDYKEMLTKMRGKINFVVVATPNYFHYEQAIASLKMGNDVLVEKPIDFLHTRVQEIEKASKKYKKRAYSVLQVRYNSILKAVRVALKDKIFGDIRSVSLIQRWQRPEQYFESWRADIKMGGRTLYEVGIHYLDIMQWLFGLPDVSASSSFSNKHKHVAFEDTVFAILKFPSGASGSVEVTIAAEPSNLECSLSILGSEGFLKIGGKALDQIDSALFSSTLVKQKWETLIKDCEKSLDPNSYGAYLGSCPNHPSLYKEIASGRGLDISESVNSIKLIENIYSKEVKFK